MIWYYAIILVAWPTWDEFRLYVTPELKWAWHPWSSLLTRLLTGFYFFLNILNNSKYYLPFCIWRTSTATVTGWNLGKTLLTVFWSDQLKIWRTWQVGSLLWLGADFVICMFVDLSSGLCAVGTNTPTCRNCRGSDCSDNILPDILQQGLLTSGYNSIVSSDKPAGSFPFSSTPLRSTKRSVLI